MHPHICYRRSVPMCMDKKLGRRTPAETPRPKRGFSRAHSHVRFQAAPIPDRTAFPNSESASTSTSPHSRGSNVFYSRNRESGENSRPEGAARSNELRPESDPAMRFAWAILIDTLSIRMRCKSLKTRVEGRAKSIHFEGRCGAHFSLGNLALPARAMRGFVGEAKAIAPRHK